MKSSLLLILLFSLPLFSCAEGENPVCGNLVCELEENETNCPVDCKLGECGNGVREIGEQCDGTDFGGTTCETLGYAGGALSCASTCKVIANLCTEAQCENSCDEEQAMACNGDVVQICSPDGAGCLAWRDAQDCTVADLVCRDSEPLGPHCQARCTNSCTDLNRYYCAGNEIFQCVEGAAGCLELQSAEIDCAAQGRTCDETSGQARCIIDCSHECSTEGATQCFGNAIQECETNPADGCLDWVSSTDCGAGGYVCEAGSCECPDTCQLDDLRCGSNGASERCVLGDNGCPVFAPDEECIEQGMVCDGGICVCDHQCDFVGDAYCEADGLTAVTCQENPETSCRRLVATDCAAQNGFCQAGACECVNSCASAAERRCMGHVLQTCTLDTTSGCWDFQDTENCWESANVCSQSTSQCERPLLAPGYDTEVFTTSSYASINSITAATPLTTASFVDNAIVPITLPETFIYYEMPYDTIWVSTNGWISFGENPLTTNAMNNVLLPDGATPMATLYPFWDDLVLDTSIHTDASWKQYYYSSTNSLVIEWYKFTTNYPSQTHMATFQVRLYFNTYDIEFRYGTTSYWAGDFFTATIGMENQHFQVAEQYGRNLSGPLPSTWNLRYTRSTFNTTAGDAYTYYPSPETFASISGSGTPLATGATDDGNYAVSLPFDFSFNQTLYPAGTTLTANANGVLSFNTLTSSYYTNSTLPYSSFGRAMVPFWDDLVCAGATNPGCGLYTRVDGVEGSRIFTVEWYKMYRSGVTSSRISFQVRLHEETGAIEYLYDYPDFAGSFNASIGLQDYADGWADYFYSANTGPLPENLVWMPW